MDDIFVAYYRGDDHRGGVILAALGARMNSLMKISNM